MYHLDLNCKVPFRSIKTDSYMEDKKNQKFYKNGKKRLNNFKNNVDIIRLCHEAILNLIFFLTMECWCDEPL